MLQNNQNLDDQASKTDQRPQSLPDSSEYRKEAGTKYFRPVSEYKDNKSKNVAQSYINTVSSYLEKIKNAYDNGDSKGAMKLESDLADFYDVLSKRFNVPVSNKDDFDKLVQKVSDHDDVVQDGYIRMKDANRSGCFNKEDKSLKRRKDVPEIPKISEEMTDIDRYILRKVKEAGGDTTNIRLINDEGLQESINAKLAEKRQQFFESHGLTEPIYDDKGNPITFEEHLLKTKGIDVEKIDFLDQI